MPPSFFSPPRLPAHTRGAQEQSHSGAGTGTPSVPRDTFRPTNAP